jgi:hypothetical protein
MRAEYRKVPNESAVRRLTVKRYVGRGSNQAPFWSFMRSETEPLGERQTSGDGAC